MEETKESTENRKKNLRHIYDIAKRNKTLLAKSSQEITGKAALFAVISVVFMVAGKNTPTVLAAFSAFSAAAVALFPRTHRLSPRLGPLQWEFVDKSEEELLDIANTLIEGDILHNKDVTKEINKWVKASAVLCYVSALVFLLTSVFLLT